MTNFAQAECAMCHRQDYCRPLHDDKGGPRCCLMCLGRWHGEHVRRRKWGGGVVRAIAAYFDAGGKYDDVDKLKIAAGGKVYLLGYGTEDLIAQDAPQLTSELLTRAISPTHPDKHPPERRELAASVTSELVVLQPFVFPARKKEQPKPRKPRKATETTIEHPKRRTLEASRSTHAATALMRCPQTIAMPAGQNMRGTNKRNLSIELRSSVLNMRGEGKSC
jgi:hypothetical protein